MYTDSFGYLDDVSYFTSNHQVYDVEKRGTYLFVFPGAISAGFCADRSHPPAQKPAKMAPGKTSKYVPRSYMSQRIRILQTRKLLTLPL